VQKMMKRLCNIVVLLALAPATLLAHGLADNHLQIMVVDDRIKLNITVDMAVLQRIDRDGDGYVSFAELGDGRAGFENWFDSAVQIGDGSGDQPRKIFADLTTDLPMAEANGHRFDHARIVQTFTLDMPPESVTIDARSLWQVIPNLRLTVIDAASGRKFRVRNPALQQWITLP
jgi:hypothetical protein